jgi:hypothetical protein
MKPPSFLKPKGPLNIRVIHAIDSEEFRYLGALWERFKREFPLDPAVVGRENENIYLEVLQRSQATDSSSRNFVDSERLSLARQEEQ